ncbi:uncharacterized protein LOC125662936 [Ostrea edulis]|uniref:uncharacterized protein LOC125662936 n=1 Tax=Ostrea edulis TaxID=37623 RepID=UPI002095F802|nr:uncharacterized protein LOC125662936 [Ostrea edulis]
MVKIGVAQTGRSSERIVRTMLRPICSFDKENNLLLIRLFDCPGMLEHRGIGLEEMKFIIKGNTKPKSIIKSALEMKEDKDIYRDNPTKNDMMHVVVFVLRCDKTFNCEQQVADIQELLDPLGIPFLILYTAVDKIDGVTDEVERVFQNGIVKRKCEELSKLLNIDQKYILPMSNYHDDAFPRPSKNALALYNLFQMVCAAYDNLNQPENVPSDFFK